MEKTEKQRRELERLSETLPLEARNIESSFEEEVIEVITLYSFDEDILISRISNN